MADWGKEKAIQFAQELGVTLDECARGVREAGKQEYVSWLTMYGRLYQRRRNQQANAKAAMIPWKKRTADTQIEPHTLCLVINGKFPVLAYSTPLLDKALWVNQEGRYLSAVTYYIEVNVPEANDGKEDTTDTDR